MTEQELKHAFIDLNDRLQRVCAATTNALNILESKINALEEKVDNNASVTEEINKLKGAIHLVDQQFMDTVRHIDATAKQAMKIVKENEALLPDLIKEELESQRTQAALREEI